MRAAEEVHAVIEDTIRKLEESIRRNPAAPARERELLRLVAELKEELESVRATHGDRARRIAQLTAEAHEASESTGDAARRQHAAERLAESARDFEATHPKLTSIVGAIANAFASAGL